MSKIVVVEPEGYVTTPSHECKAYSNVDPFAMGPCARVRRIVHDFEGSRTTYDHGALLVHDMDRN